MKYAYSLVFGVVLCGVFVMGTPSTHALSMQEFVNLLVAEGIIAPEKANAARSVAAVFEPPQGGDTFTLRASQLIEHSRTVYSQGSEIQGLLLSVTNNTDTTQILEGRAGCHVSYYIQEAGSADVLYNSALEEECQGDERSYYFLAPKETRLHEVNHANEAYPLDTGEYTFVLEYPGYGSAQRVIVVGE